VAHDRGRSPDAALDDPDPRRRRRRAHRRAAARLADFLAAFALYFLGASDDGLLSPLPGAQVGEAAPGGADVLNRLRHAERLRIAAVVGRVPRLHHAKSDTPEDISSPGVGGFWWSQLRWLWQAGNRARAAVLPRHGTAPRFTSGERCRSRWRWRRSCAAPVRAGGVPLAGPIRLTWAASPAGFVNSICHMRKVSSPGEGTAKNVAWLSLFHAFQGENCTRTTTTARLRAPRLEAPSSSNRLYTILLLEKLGLATDVRRPDLGRSMDAAGSAVRRGVKFLRRRAEKTLGAEPPRGELESNG